MGERGGGRRGDLGRGGRRDIFCSGKKARRMRVGACTSVQGQRQEMLQVPVGAGMGLGGCWCWCLDQPEVGRGEAGAAAPLSRIRCCGLAGRGGRILGSGSAGTVCTASVGTEPERGRAGRPGHAWPPRACRRWVLGRGEEGRRISAPNSICWRTWPAPRQAENSTYVRTCTQCWLCPRRALPSCCAPRSAPALRLLPPAPRSPPPPPPPSHGGQVSGKRLFWLLRASSFWQSGVGAQSWSPILSPSAAFHISHKVRPAAASPPLSSGAGEDERGSRREPSFIRNWHLAPAPPLQPPAQARAQDRATSTHECPGSCSSRRGTSTNPHFPRLYLQIRY